MLAEAGTREQVMSTRILADFGRFLKMVCDGAGASPTAA